MPFTCETAAAALGFPEAKVVLCKEATVLRGLYRVRLEGTPAGRLDRSVAVEAGQVVTQSGGAALAGFLRRSPMWGESRIAAEELRDALDAFDARPPGFDRQSGPPTVDERGRSAWIGLPALSLRLETSRASWERARGQGVSRAPSLVRATLRGSPTQPFVWTVDAQQGADWVVVETLPLEP